MVKLPKVLQISIPRNIEVGQSISIVRATNERNGRSSVYKESINKYEVVGITEQNNKLLRITLEKSN